MKIFDGKIDPPSLIHKLIRHLNISETQHRRVPLRKVTVQWDKTISTENWDGRPHSYTKNVLMPEDGETLNVSP